VLFKAFSPEYQQMCGIVMALKGDQRASVIY
jgi:hypothetical protein